MKRIFMTSFALAVAAACGAGVATFAQQGLETARAQVGGTGAAAAKPPSPAAVQAAKVVLHVNQNDPAIMNLALNNAQNVASHYKVAGQPVTIEVVAYGPGLHMLRADTSPIKSRLASFGSKKRLKE